MHGDFWDTLYVYIYIYIYIYRCQNIMDLLVAAHFNSANHVNQDFQVCVIKACSGDLEMKRLESRFSVWYDAPLGH